MWWSGGYNSSEVETFAGLLVGGLSIDQLKIVDRLQLVTATVAEDGMTVNRGFLVHQKQKTMLGKTFG